MLENIDFFILIYYVFMTVILFCFMGIDKQRAVRGKWRITERTLLLLSAVGAAVGGYAGMFFFRHKKRKWYFHLTFMISILLHSLFLVFVLLRA